MSFIDTVRRARELLRAEGRITLRGLKREFALDEEALEELVEELVDGQRVAAREGKVVSWVGGARSGSAVREPEVGASARAAEAERRQLTVLFCDLVDSTELASRLDAEDWRDVVRRFQQVSAEAFESFEGHVAQYLGDGLLVYFGYPQAHEDDAERAVRAGLGVMDALGDLNPELEERHGLRLEVRVGIHTGPVVVGEMGGGAKSEMLAMGDTANVAARIQGLAEPGAVALSSATLRLVSGIFVTEDLGEKALKGIAEPVRAFRALQPTGVRSRLDVLAATELTPFVGREQELGLLEDRFVQVAEGSGQVVFVCGEAGIGKSRLVQAFRERLTDRAHTWLECRGSPYTQESALLPVIELQRRGLGFRPEDDQDAKLAALEVGLAGLEFDLAQTVPLLAGVHGVGLGDYDALGLSPEGTRKKTLALLTEWLLRLGRRQPLVLLTEDLHWMDPSTVELLGQILEQIPTAPVLMLATYRPDFELPWGARSHVTPMLLSRFTRAQLGDLVRKAARDRDLPDPWLEEILRRADGVPLFAEELTRAVLEAHPELPEGGSIAELRIPETLQDSLTARLDALGPLKELAQLSSVLGREFDYELLLAVSPMKEAELQAALGAALREELFYQRGTPPDATYLFRHALIRDAAYQSLLRSSRQRHHMRVAETMIERMPITVEVQPELVAHHLTEAGDAERALDYWQRAGEHANARAAYEEALGHARRGLGVLDRAAGSVRERDQELALQIALATALVAARGYSNPETRQTWERALALCDSVADPTRRAVVQYGLGNTLVGSGDPVSALQSYTEALRIAEEAGDELLTIAGHYGRATGLYFTGRIGESCEQIRRAISLYDPDRHKFGSLGFTEDPGIGSWCEAGWHLWAGGFPEQAVTASRQGIALARESQQPYSLAFALTWGAATAAFRREIDEARRLASDAAAFSDEQGFPMLAGLSRIVEAWAAGLEGRDVAAIDHFLSAMVEASAGGQQGGAPQMLGWLAELQLAAGRETEAAGSIDGALGLSATNGESYFDAELHRLRGERLLGLPEDGDAGAEQEFRRALEIARLQEARSFELRAATSLARLWQRQDDRTAARHLLRPVYDWFTEGFDTPDLVDAKALLDELGSTRESD